MLAAGEVAVQMYGAAKFGKGPVGTGRSDYDDSVDLLKKFEADDDKIINHCILRAQRAAVRLLARLYPEIEAVAKRLRRKGQLSQAEIDQAIRAASL